MARKIEFAAGVAERGLNDPYKTGYSTGWRASQRFATGGPKWTSPLERADAREATDAYYDGYADHAAGRDKWHLPNCFAHHNGDGGCGEA